MIDVYYWGTPNGLKIKLFLEEAGRDFATWILPWSYETLWALTFPKKSSMPRLRTSTRKGYSTRAVSSRHLITSRIRLQSTSPRTFLGAN